jgi:hypothetical protein
MSALAKKETKEVRVHDDIKIVYHIEDKPNRTNLKAHEERAVIANLRADLVLPTNKILTVDIDFDSTSGYHGNTMMVMDDFGVEMLATAFAVKYGQQYADKITQEWAKKQHPDDPRKPTYILVQKPNSDDDVPRVFVACGADDHDDKDTKFKSIV